MSFLVGNKKRYIATILVLCMSFVLIMVWSVYTYTYLNNKQYESKQSYVIAEQYKLLYENDRNTVLTMEPLLDKSMARILKDVSADIKKQDSIDTAYLKLLKDEYSITGIWLIEGDKVVHLSSEGIKNTDASKWYKDRPEIEWNQKLDWLIKNKDSAWIDTFSKRNTAPHEYYKWAYMGMGEVPQLGGKVVLEIGMNVDDAFSATDIKSVMKDNHTVSKNILDAVISIPDPQTNKPVKEYQTRDKDNLTTSVKAKDFNNQDTQIIIKTHFPEIHQENTGVLVVCVASSLFTVLCLGLLLLALLRKQHD